MKIVYCLNSISTIGGIEKVTFAKAKALSQINHNEVFVLVTDHKNKTNQSLSPTLHIIDLDIDYYEDDWKSNLNVLKALLFKRRKHKKKISALLRELNPDIVIAVGQSEKYFLPKIKGSWITIREFHYEKYYRNRRSRNFFERIVANAINFYDYNITIKKYDHIIVLTHNDQFNWKSFKNIKVIPNPIILEPLLQECTQEKKILAIGRLEKEKNFNSLINICSEIFNIHKDWSLEIYGEGSQKRILQKMIEDRGLEGNIFLKGWGHDMNKIYKSASFLVVTSKYEGFGMVITEAMSNGIPVISYDCPCGPKEIIENGKNGFLIPYGNEESFKEKILFLIENTNQCKIMGRNAQKRSLDFSIENISKRWMELFQSLKNKEKQ